MDKKYVFFCGKQNTSTIENVYPGKDHMLMMRSTVYYK